jgi:hypothetical protein
MAADLTTLVPAFGAKLGELLTRCAARGVTMRPYAALRTPLEQSRLWRQSRSAEEIGAQIAAFRAAGAEFLANCLESVGPQHGDPVTNAPPGLSWHQWGEAVDSFWLVENRAEWSTAKKVNGLNGYRVYAEEAEGLGLTAGGLWATLKDWPHVQSRREASPVQLMQLAAVSEEMQRRFPP